MSQRRESPRGRLNARAIFPNPAVGNVPDVLLGIVPVSEAAPPCVPQVGHVMPRGLDEPLPATADERYRHSITDPRTIARKVMHVETNSALALEPCHPLYRVLGEKNLRRCVGLTAKIKEPHILAKNKDCRARPKAIPWRPAKHVIGVNRER